MNIFLTLFFISKLFLSDCNTDITYYVDSNILTKNLKNVQSPKTNPYLEKGIDETQMFFDEIKFDSTLCKNKAFRIHISFLVDCKGNTSDFKIINPAEEFQNIENKILNQLKYYNIIWKPATNKNFIVPCYQIFSLTYYNCELTNIFYKSN